MKNLFEKNYSLEVDRRTNEVKELIETCYRNEKVNMKDLKDKMYRLMNFRAYEYFRLGGYVCFLSSVKNSIEYNEFLVNTLLLNKTDSGIDIYQIEGGKLIKRIHSDSSLVSLEFPTDLEKRICVDKFDSIAKIASELGIDLSKNKFTDRINSLYCKYKDFLDSTEKAFLSDFTGNFCARIYELVMANFLDKKFNLKKRLSQSGFPDFEINLNDKKYLFECSTANANEMDKFCEKLPVFDNYFEIANIFFEKCYQLQNQPGWNGVAWYYIIEQLWVELLPEQKDKIAEILEKSCNYKKSDNVSLLFKEIESWICYNLYAYHLFSNILPATLTEKFEKIFTMAGRSNNDRALKEFCIDYAALKVIDKLNNAYSNERTPVIISISLATMADPLLIHRALKNFGIAELLQERIKKRAIEGQNLENLYAIIIDTTWYNWFPDIIEKLGYGHFPDGYDLFLMSNETKPEQGKVYVRAKNGKIVYTVITLKDGAVKDVDTGITAPAIFTLETLKPLKDNILETTSKAGHTLPDDVKNCYYVIYNKKVGESLQWEPYIFDSLIKERLEIFIDYKPVSLTGAA